MRRPACLVPTVVVLALSMPAGRGGSTAGSRLAASAPEYEMELREASIPMPDGVRLAADLYMPTGGAPDATFPVLLEYLPYRKTEGRRRNHALYSHFVHRGYIVARVDIRGTGNSEGTLIPHEYSEREQKDGEAVIEWLSRQRYSSGAVGMFGISWGGFNAIHMAMRNPSALKAIIAVCATDDLYQDDVHFIDGIMHVDSWEMSQDLDNARPGAPDYVIDDEYFRQRFDTEPWMLTYKGQQRDGSFWDRAALNKRYDSIRIPTFVIGGWYDGYRDSIPRMLQHLDAPVKAIIGPWSHFYPHNAYPKPQIEWRHEAVRWFDHWLKGRDTGIMKEPALALFVRRWHPPGPVLEEAPGEWRWEDGWPIDRIRSRALYPRDDHTLALKAPEPTEHRLRYVPTSGIEVGGPVMWWGDIAPDQRPSDAYSLVYDSAPLDEDLEILGLPLASLQVAADAPRANWFVRLNDVAPDGAVTLVAGAGFNGTHRSSATAPRALHPGERIELEVEMHFTSWVFPRGHRIRLAVGNAQWPMMWPTPHPMTTTLFLGGDTSTRLELPVVPHARRPVPAFLPPGADPQIEGFTTLDTGTTSGYGEITAIERDTARRTTRVIALDSGGTRYPWGTEHYGERIVHEAQDDHPETASVSGEHDLTVELEDRVLTWQGRLSFSSDVDSFYYTYTRRLLKNGALVREKSWNRTIPRDFQ